MAQNLDLPREGFARPAQAAHALGVSRGTLYNRVKDGSLPAPIKDGRLTLFPVEVIRDYIKSRGGSVHHEACPDNPPTPAS